MAGGTGCNHGDARFSAAILSNSPHLSLVRLTSAAAEVMFRRRLFKRHGGISCRVAAVSLCYQIYPPLDLDLMPGFFGALCLCCAAIAVVLERRARYPPGT